METAPVHSGDLPQEIAKDSVHPSTVSPAIPPLRRSVGSVAPAAVVSRKAYEGLSASSVGLELGLSVVIGLLGGYYLDRATGTSPLFLFVFLGFGLIAGFRGVLRYVARADRAAAHEEEAARRG
jgi:ATP synthase protein I